MIQNEKFTKLVERAIKEFQNDPKKREFFCHNLSYFFQVNAARLVANERPIDFDFRADYWFTAEVRVAILFFNEVFDNEFYPPATVRKAIFLIVQHLKNKRNEGFFKGLYGEGEYKDPEHFRHNLKLVREAIAVTIPALSVLESDLKRDNKRFGRTNMPLLKQFDVLLQELEKEGKWQKMDATSFYQRVRFLHYFTAKTEEDLAVHARFFSAWYTLFTSTNSYQSIAIKMGPVLGNSKTKELLDIVNAWCSGKTLKETQFFAHDSRSAKPLDRSSYTAILELYGFCRLASLPIVNKSVLAQYREHLGFESDDNGALQEELGKAFGRLPSGTDIREFGARTWKEYLEKAISDVRTTIMTEQVRSEEVAQKYANDLFYVRFDKELRDYATKFASGLSARQIEQVTLQLIVDAMLHASYSQEEKEDQATDKEESEATSTSAAGEVEPLASCRSPTPMPNYPLNQILYGPPGTGKTYSAVYRALEIVDGTSFKDVSDEKLRRTKAMARLEELRKSGQVEMVTFHPGYSYEDFVEGIAPVLEREGMGQGVRYDIRRGVFYQIVQRMQGGKSTIKLGGFNPDGRVWKVSLRTDGEDLTEQCIQEEWIGFDYGIDEPIQGKSVDEFFEGRDSKEGKDVFRCLIEKMQEGDLVCVLKDQQSIQAIGVVSGAYSYAGKGQPLPHRRRVRWLDHAVHDVLAINDGKLLGVAALHELRRMAPEKVLELVTKITAVADSRPHVLIIDEINRGNLSRIFGELITLLEDDKRIGSDNEMRVKLAYSGNDFGVPANLFVIGTMNSADRSIALMDTALRRRFDFERLPPNLILIPEVVDSIPLREIVTAMNEKIAALLGEDLEIGHAYFLGGKATNVGSLKETWFKRILPLVNEYVYGDGEKLAQLVGGFAVEVSDGEVSGRMFASKRYRIADRNMSDDEFKTHMIGLVPAAARKVG